MPTADYERVIDTITERIKSGQYPPGSTLPSMRVLAEELHTSLTTVRTAFVVLRREGRIWGQQGKGVYVSDPQPPTPTAPPGP